MMVDKTHFTMVYDDIVADVGLIAAAVYGVVWRFCQMRGRSCYASHETIAGIVGVAVASVKRGMKLLRERGYIVDTTPDVVGRPHVYVTADMIATLSRPTEVSQTHYSSSQRPTIGAEESEVCESYYSSAAMTTAGEKSEVTQTPDLAHTDPYLAHRELPPSSHRPTNNTINKTINRPEEDQRAFSALFPQSGAPAASHPLSDTGYWQVRRELRALLQRPLFLSERTAVAEAITRYGPDTVLTALHQAADAGARAWEDVATLFPILDSAPPAGEEEHETAQGRESG